MFKRISISSLVLGAVLLLTPMNVSAWSTSQIASADCEGPDAVISWSFSNTEPNEPRWSMDVVATDNQTGVSSNKVTVAPGETATGEFNTGDNTINSGSVTFALTWTDGRSGIDSRTSNYDATDCIEEVQPPEFSAMVKCTLVNDLAQYTLKINQSNSTPAVFSPGDGTELGSGNPISVTATYTDEYQQSQTVTVTATGTDNCEDPIEVCRDGEVITILPSQRQDSDTEVPCPVEPQPIEVCRDGVVISIDEDERLDTDTNLPCPQVQGDVKELPNTGFAGIAGSFIGTSALAMSARSWLESRSMIRASLKKEL